MDFLIELILEIFGAAAEEALDSPKVSLKIKIIVISVLCGALFLLSLGLGVYFAVTADAMLAAAFIGIALLFLSLGIFGIRKQIKRHTR